MIITEYTTDAFTIINFIIIINIPFNLISHQQIQMNPSKINTINLSGFFLFIFLLFLVLFVQLSSSMVIPDNSDSGEKQQQQPSSPPPLTLPQCNGPNESLIQIGGGCYVNEKGESICAPAKPPQCVCNSGFERNNISNGGKCEPSSSKSSL